MIDILPLIRVLTHAHHYFSHQLSFSIGLTKLNNRDPNVYSNILVYGQTIKITFITMRVTTGFVINTRGRSTRGK